MAARRPANQPTDPAKSNQLAMIVALGGAALGLVAQALHYPGFIVAWVVVFIAANLSAPTAFTGPKAPGTSHPQPANEWERELARKHRFWSSLRTQLWLPSNLWPGKRIALEPIAAIALAAFVWWLPVGGQDYSLQLSEGGVPVEIDAIPPEYHAALTALNAWFALVLAVEVSATAARFASDFEPRPRVGLLDIADAVRASVGQRVATGVAASLSAVGVFLGIIYVTTFEPVAAILTAPTIQAAALCVAAAAWSLCALHHGRVTEPWADRVEAASTWRDKWSAQELKMPTPPRLIDHQTLWDGRIIVDLFEAPPGIGASGMMEPRKNSYGDILSRLFGGQAQVSILDAEDTDASGKPQPGTRSDIRFRVARRLGDDVPNPADPRTPQEVVKIAFEMAMVAQSSEVKSMPPLLAAFEPIVAPPAATAGEDGGARDVLMEEAPEEAPLDYTMAWKATCYDLGGLGALTQTQTMLPYSFGEADNVEAYLDGSDLYFGAVTASTTPLADESLRARLEELAVIARWKQRWADTVTAAKIPQGAAPYDAMVSASKTVKLDVRSADERSAPERGKGRARGRSGVGVVELQVMPFRMMQGVNLQNYFRPATEASLVTAVAGAPFLYCAGYPDYAPGQREGTRRNDAFSVVWSEKPIPTNPAKIPADLNPDGGSSLEAAGLLFGGIVSHAFDAAKLERPEVIRAENVTGPKTRENIWRVRVRLYEGVSLEDVRKKLQTIRSRIGCEWLQVTGTLEADVVVFAMGASPDAPSVEFSGRGADRNRAWCEQVRWEAAFIDAKLMGVGGAAPQMQSTAPMDTNPKVTLSVFSVPAGTTIADFVNASEKLQAALGIGYVQARPGPSPSLVEMLSSPEDPMPMPAPVDWRAMFAKEQSPLSIPFATNAEGATVEFDLKFDPHLLVLGGTGSGKSITLSVFLEAYLLRGFDCFLADPVKSGADFQFAAPYMRAITGDLFETREMLNWMGKEKDRRKALNAQHGVGSIADLPDDVRPRRIAVFLDEFTSLLLTDGPPRKLEGDESPEMLLEIEREREISLAKRTIGLRVGQLAREARSAGIHLVLATQALKADTLKGVGGGDLKALDLDTRVPVPVSERFPDGWATIGDLDLGDRVFTPTGGTAPIAAMSPTLLDGEAYEVEFDDGQTVIADAGHIWEVSTEKDRSATRDRLRVGDFVTERSRLQKRRLLTTQELVNHMSQQGPERTRSLSVALPDPVDTDPVALPVDPYVLGAWLGDGSTGTGILTSDGKTDDQQHLIERLTQAGYSGHRIDCDDNLVGTFGLKVSLRAAGVLDDKHIPSSYLRASFEQRLELLRGLMDTDGSVDTNGRACIVQVRESLAEQILELVRSLGLKASISTWPSRYRDAEGTLVLTGQTVYALSFHAPFAVFSLPRKAAKQRISERHELRQRYIRNIRSVEARPVRCISLDNEDGMFLVEGFIPTHNSNLARLALGNMSFGDMQSALRNPQDAAHLRVPGGVFGRGIFESNQPGPTQVVQSWFAEDRERGMNHKQALTDALVQRLQPVPPEGKVDLTALVLAQERETTVFGQEIDQQSVFGAEPDSVPEQVVDLGTLEVEFEFDFSDGAELDQEQQQVDATQTLAADAVASPVASMRQAPDLLPAAAVEGRYESVSGQPMLMLDVRGVVATKTMPLGWEDAVPTQFEDGSWWVSPSALNRIGQLRAVIAWSGVDPLADPLAEAVNRELSVVIPAEATAQFLDEHGHQAVWIRAEDAPDGISSTQLDDLEARFGTDRSTEPAGPPPVPVIAEQQQQQQQSPVVIPATAGGSDRQHEALPKPVGSSLPLPISFDRGHVAADRLPPALPPVQF